jgi:hypothetical protein
VGSAMLAVLAFGVGALMVVATVLSATMTLVVPRALPVRITRLVFTGMRALFRLHGSRARSFEARDLAPVRADQPVHLAATWLVLLAMLISYLPSMYQSFPRRPRRSAADRRLLLRSAQPRPALAGGPDLDRRHSRSRA